MTAIVESLGLVPTAANLSWWLLRELAPLALPRIRQWLADPAATVARVGDVLVWEGNGGQQVLAGLESLAESSARIQEAVGHVEQAQIGVGQALGALTSLSMSTLGFGALAAGFMTARLAALDSRLKAVAAQVSDVAAQLTAQNRAHIGAALTHLQYHENGKGPADLQEAKSRSTFATQLYRTLVQNEVHGQKRLLALHECGRHYLLALSVQVRCLVLADALDDAAGGIGAEEKTMAELAQALFDQVLGPSPATYLDLTFQEQGVGLELLAEVYQQASQVGVKTGVEAANPARLFEHLRGRIGAAPLTGSYWPWESFEEARARRLRGLKYLMACLEEVNRVRGFRLRIEDARKNGYSLGDLERQIKPLRDQAVAGNARNWPTAFGGGFNKKPSLCKMGAYHGNLIQRNGLCQRKRRRHSGVGRREPSWAA